MNKFWIFLIIISIAFGLVNGKEEELVDALFEVPNEVINVLLKLGSVLIIYNGLFQIAIKTNIISKLSFLFRGFVEKVFGFKKHSYLNDTISTSIIANMLGLGAANTAIALKVVEEIKREKGSEVSKELAMYLLINISSFVILPLSLIGIRESYNALINLLFIPILCISSFLTTLFSIFLVKLVYK